MKSFVLRAGLLIGVLHLLLVTTLPAEPVDGERMLTPNQQRHIVQVNQDLPKDILDKTGDSQRVTELRGHLREKLAAYKQTVKQFGTGTPEAHLAAQKVVETQTDLHKQFIQEEAIPAIASR